MEVAAQVIKQKGYQAVRLEADAQVLRQALPSLFALVLPYPVSRDGESVTGTSLSLASLTHLLPEKPPLLIGGAIPAALRPYHALDAEAVEPFLQDNAHLTAVAGITAALHSTERALLGVRVCVLGYGRIGRKTAAMAHALGACVTVCVRRKEAADAAFSDGFIGRLLAEGLPTGAEVIFSTIPAPAPQLASLRPEKNALIYDLGGGLPVSLLDGEGAAVPVTALRGAPGVFAPLAAGQLYGKAILSLLEDVNESHPKGTTPS